MRRRPSRGKPAVIGHDRGVDDEQLRRIFAATRTIAVLGIHAAPERPAHYVPAYLYQQGYRILGVNPALRGELLFGERCVGSLAELAEPVDMVDVFRRPEALPPHIPEILAMSPAPACVWLQLGIRHDEMARQITAAGITFVQDRCTLADHRRLGIGPRRAGGGAAAR